jgi:hypothetical protein
MTRTPEEIQQDITEAGRRVVRAVDALRLFGGDMSREQAAALLEMWAHRSELSPADVESVLELVGTS